MSRQLDEHDRYALSTDKWDGAIFDLDGVITETATVHFATWKEAFDDLLRDRQGPDFEPFTEADYRAYVDGKPRLEGAESFLAARGIALPAGSADDPPGRQTIHGVGNAKNTRYREQLRAGNFHVYEPSVELVRSLGRHGVAVGIVSSSKNCRDVLRHAGIADLFEARVDGIDLEEDGRLRGKPAPDMFLEAARRLEVDRRRTVVFEDAEAGVEAGRAGEFGLVVGVARSAEACEALGDHGADLVATSLGAFEVVGGRGPRPRA